MRKVYPLSLLGSEGLRYLFHVSEPNLSALEQVSCMRVNTVSRARFACVVGTIRRLS